MFQEYSEVNVPEDLNIGIIKMLYSIYDAIGLLLQDFIVLKQS